jgi:hypothetical protein
MSSRLVSHIPCGSLLAVPALALIGAVQAIILALILHYSFGDAMGRFAPNRFPGLILVTFFGMLAVFVEGVLYIRKGSLGRIDPRVLPRPLALNWARRLQDEDLATCLLALFELYQMLMQSSKRPPVERWWRELAEDQDTIEYMLDRLDHLSRRISPEVCEGQQTRGGDLSVIPYDLEACVKSIESVRRHLKRLVSLSHVRETPSKPELLQILDIIQGQTRIISQSIHKVLESQ